MKKVSVIIPVYNAESFLRECLDSVLNQTLQDFEIICVDDGSTDNSLHILNEYAEKDNRIIVLTQKNQYAGVARNYGMSVANGEFCAFLDSDDSYLENALETLYKAATLYELDMVKGSFYLFEEDINQPKTSLYSRNACIPDTLKNRVLTFNDAPEELIFATDVPWNGIYRMSFLKEHRITFNSLRCVNDHSFFVHCLVCANRLMFINDYITYYRYGQSASLIGTKANHFDNQIESFRIITKLIAPLPHEQKQIIYEREFDAIAGWYLKVRDQSTSPKLIDHQMDQFINHEFKDYYVRSNFWETYRHKNVYFKFKENFEETTITSHDPVHNNIIISKAAYSLNKLHRFFLCCRTRGVGYTLKYSAKRVYSKLTRKSASEKENIREKEPIHK